MIYHSISYQTLNYNPLFLCCWEISFNYFNIPIYWNTQLELNNQSPRRHVGRYVPAIKREIDIVRQREREREKRENKRGRGRQGERERKKESEREK